jgi:hypothetical protein
VDAEDIEDLLGGGSTTEARGGERDATPESGRTRGGNESETGDRGQGGDSANGENSHQFADADLVVTVSDDIVINDVQVLEGSYEQVLLVGGGGIGAVSLLDNSVDADVTLEGFISGFVSEMDDAEEIDSGEDNGVAWSLYEVSVDDQDMYVYATVDGTRFDNVHHLELIAAPVEIFERQFVDFQESVDVDGVTMFADTDVNDLMDILKGI